jgi:hypothetical protein
MVAENACGSNELNCAFSAYAALFLRTDGIRVFESINK